MINDKFIIVRQNTFSKKYRAIFYSSSYDSSINDKIYIYNILKIYNIKQGYILCDLLLSKGNNFNRFVELYIDNYKIKKIEILKDVNNTIYDNSSKFYTDNKYLFNNSIFKYYYNII